MKKFRYSLVATFALVSGFTSHASSGGGGMTGDGFPTNVHLESSQLTSLPAQEHLRGVVRGIAKEFPTLSLLLSQAIDRFADAGSQYKARRLLAENVYSYASFEASRAQVNHVPESSGILYWNGFFTLPVSDSAPETEADNHPSQVKVTLHELIHILFTGFDEATTTRLTSLLYKLGDGGTLTLLELQNVSRAVDPLIFSSLEGHSLGEQKEVLFVRARGLSHACADFTRSEEIQVAGRVFTFPVIPSGFSERLALDPFYAHYRNKCLSTLPQGELVLGPLRFQLNRPHIRDSAALFRDPLLRAKLLHGLTGKKLKFEFTENGIEYQDRGEYLSQLFFHPAGPNPQPVDRPRNALLVRNQVIERIIPGYGDWAQVFKRNYPEGLSEENSISYTDLMMLPAQLIHPLIDPSLLNGYLLSFGMGNGGMIIEGGGIIREDYEISLPRRTHAVACVDFHPRPIKTHFGRTYFQPVELSCGFSSWRDHRRGYGPSSRHAWGFTLADLLTVDRGYRDSIMHLRLDLEL